jgi:hypothetical protein
VNVEVVNATAEVTVLGPAEVVVEQANTEVEVAVGGAQGPQGPKGDTGDTGPTGPGVPVGGTAGQLLVKDSATDYDSQWTGHPHFVDLVAGDVITQPARMFAGGLPVVGQMDLAPFYLWRTTTLDGIGWYQWGANTTAGAEVRLGIYASDKYRRPSALVADYGTTPWSSVAGLVFLSINETLSPGVYWAALVPQGVAANGSVGQGEAFSAWLGNTIGDPTVATNVTNGFGQTYLRTGITGALPDPVGAIGTTVGTTRRIFVRVA